MTGLFFDTETSGIKTRDNPNFVPQLVQLGAILQDLDTGRVLAEVNLMNNQCGDIPVEASNVHHITRDLAEQSGVHLKLIDYVFAHLVAKADLVVAHNIAYDLDIVKDNMPVTQGVIGDVPQFCTMMASLYVVKAPLSEKQKILFERRPELKDAPFKTPNLTETFKHFFGVPFVGAHDAMADIRACRDVFMSLLEHRYYQFIDDKLVTTAKLRQLQEIL